MKILITGAAGFIGFHLTKKLLEAGHKITGIDNLDDYYDVNLKKDRLRELGIAEGATDPHKPATGIKYPAFSFFRLDLKNKDSLSGLFNEHNFDAVCNLAAQAGVRYSLENPFAYIDNNINGFINLLEACRHRPVRHLVFASSSSVYGDSNKFPFQISDNTDHPVSLYAATKKKQRADGSCL